MNNVKKFENYEFSEVDKAKFYEKEYKESALDALVKVSMYFDFLGDIEGTNSERKNYMDIKNKIFDLQKSIENFENPLEK
jgi:hypothetical protein